MATMIEMLEGISGESSRAQSLLRLAWVGCMNLNDNGFYRFDPDESDEERSVEELHGIMAAIEECVNRLQLMDGEIERVCRSIVEGEC